MKRLFAAVLVVLAVLVSFGCSGADPVTDPGPIPGDPPTTPVVTPVPTPVERHPRPDLPCWKNPANC
jgi:hypothetical protein